MTATKSDTSTLKSGMRRAREILSVKGVIPEDPRRLMAEAIVTLRDREDGPPTDYLKQWPRSRKVEFLLKGKWSELDLAGALTGLGAAQVAHKELELADDHLTARINHVSNIRQDYRHLRGPDFAAQLQAEMIRLIFSQAIENALDSEQLDLSSETRQQLTDHLTESYMPENVGDLNSDQVYELHNFISELAAMNRTGLIQILSQPTKPGTRAKRRAAELPTATTCMSAQEKLSEQTELIAGFMDHLDREGYLLARHDSHPNWLPRRGPLALASMGDEQRQALILKFLTPGLIPG